ncbi:MAG: chorismate pyruvate-lyase family protein [Nitrososphaerales archaeon]
MEEFINLIQKLEKQLNVGLSGVQKILLTTDGSITRILEALSFERIIIRTLKKKPIKASGKIAHELNYKGTISYREVLLMGKESGRCYIFAKSWVPINRLDSDYAEDILSRDEPIGKILQLHKLESRRNIIKIGSLKSKRLKKFFKTEEDIFLRRAYHIIHKDKVLIKIEEYFPLSSFKSYAGT